jgi:alpha-amylase
MGVEWALNMLGGGGNPSAWIEPRTGERVRFDGEGQVDGATSFGLGNDWIGIEVRTTVTPAADVWWSSIDTVSISEDGFERTHQGSSVLFSWPLALEPGGEFLVRMTQAVRTSRDRAVDEGL